MQMKLFSQQNADYIIRNEHNHLYNEAHFFKNLFRSIVHERYHEVLDAEITYIDTLYNDIVMEYRYGST
jgi:hypothetical protein